MTDQPALAGVEIELRTRCRVLGPLEEPHDHLDGYAGVVLGLFLTDEGVSLSAPIGTIEASVVRIWQAQDSGLPLSEVFDAEEDLANEFYPALVGKDDEIRPELIEMPGDVLVLERLRIDKPWRGRKIGLAALAETIRLVGRGCALAALQPAPLNARRLTDTARAQATRRLAAYYEQLSFRQVRQTTIWATALDSGDFDRAYELLHGDWPF